MNDAQPTLPERYLLADDPILGEGGMGRVLLVHDVILDVPVALKVVRPDLAADDRFRQLFDVEVRISARFTHPHIVPLHDHGTFPDGTPYLGLAYADGGSFASFRQDLPAWPELLRLTIELLDALAHLHARGVLHRDLKPENVLLHTGADGLRHVWLADLGLANASSALFKRKGRMEGTPGFMSPEQRMGMPREYGPWTDLYSLGVMLWELLTGDRPFADHETSADADLPAFQPKEGVVVPSGFEIVLANLLSPEPLSRYDLAADLVTELRAIERGVVVDGFGGGGAPTTVAPAAPMPSVNAGNGMWKEGSTMFRLCASDLKSDGRSPDSKSDPNVPIWNRPIPEPMPPEPFLEPGFGATARGSLQLFAMRELPLVARDDLRAKVWAEAHQVVEIGASRVVLLVGEAGAGKSHLIESVCRAFEEGGWAEAVHLSWQNPPGKEDGYAGAARALVRPWNESRASLIGRLRRRLARERGVLDAAVREEATLLARWSGLSQDGEEPVPVGLGLREVYRHLEARTWRGMSVLVLDDVQWALEDGDGLSIAETLLQSAQEGEKKRTLVIAALRAESLLHDAALAQRVEALLAAGATRIDVPRLNRAGTEALLHECLTLDPSLSSIIVDRCEGNPLFARQLLLEWSRRGWLEDKGGLQFGLSDGVDVAAVIPADAVALLLERVEGMAGASPQYRRFRDGVHLAALAGMDLPPELLGLLMGTELEEFARGCGLWVPRGELLRFDGALLHEAVREQAQTRPDGGFLHRRIGRAWKRYGEMTSVSVPLQVGRHALLGRDFELAVPNLLQASEAAYQRGRTRELDEAARLAVAATEGAAGKDAGWAWLWMARAAQVRGEVSEANNCFQRSFDAFQAVEVARGALEARLGLAWAALQVGELDTSEQLYNASLESARMTRAPELEVRALLGKGWLEQQKRNFEGADILFQRGGHRAGQVGDRRSNAEGLLGQAFVARRTGAFAEAEELYDDAVDALQELDDLLGIAKALVGQAVVARQRRELDKADAQLREALQTSEELGAAEIAMEARLGLAELARVQGDGERARRLYDVHLRWAERQNSLEARIFSHLGLAVLALQEDDLAGCYAHADAAQQVLKGVPGHWLWATYRLVVATMLARRGDQDQTWRWLWSASELGLADTVDHDIAALLSEIVTIAAGQSWSQVLRVAGKLARDQLTRLNDPVGLARVTEALRQTGRA